MNQKEIKDNLIRLISKLFAEQGVDIDCVEYTDLIEDWGMDSITFISFVVEIEAMFKIIIPNDMLLMENFKEIDDIVLMIFNQLSISKEDK